MRHKHPRRHHHAPKHSKPLFGGAGIKLVYALIGGLFATNVATGIVLLWSPDIAVLLDRQQTRDISAYESRITQLRLEVDRLHSRQYARAGDINLQLQDLMQQQELLAEQQEYVRTLATMAERLGIDTADVTLPSAPQLPSAPDLTGDPAVDAVAGQISSMQSETLGALSALTDAADQGTNQILSEMNRIGLEPEIRFDASALGGPYEPGIDDSGASAHIVAANAVIAAFARFELARDAVRDAPVHRPLLGTLSISSNFGNRPDPFNGRTAYHSGIDFRSPSGTDVLAAGAGRVVFAGRNAGYGNMIDIDHGDGIVTRYSHLSAIGVREGQMIDVGDIIGNVGSTGRSTGPHLHFEVRRNDEAVDPGVFLAAGRRLASLI